MPLLGLMHLLVGIGFAVHAMKSGRPQYWLWILLMVPFAGSIAYVLIELVPELARSRGARKMGSDLRTIADPDRELRQRMAEADRTDSADAKRRLAEAFEAKSMWPDAIRLYKEAAQGLHADDTALLLGLARAQLGGGLAAEAQATLDRLRAAHPDFQSQEGHLIYARALEEQRRFDEAKSEYEALSHYFAGYEARVRYGLMLLRLGEPSRARALFQSVVDAAGAKPAWTTEDDKEWLKVASANLG